MRSESVCCLQFANERGVSHPRFIMYAARDGGRKEFPMFKKNFSTISSFSVAICLLGGICFANGTSDYIALFPLYDGTHMIQEKAYTGRRYTMEQFNKIEYGMSYQQCVQILGSEGEFMFGTVNSAAYMWSGQEDGSLITLDFTDGVVVSKGQSGLR